MPGRLSRPLLPSLLGLLTIALFYLAFSSTPASAKMTSARDADAAAAGPLSHLRVSLHQSSTSPATIIARVTNDDPSTAYTLVAWDTPLDPLAIKLGLATLTLPSTGEVLSLPIIQIRRKLPPDAASIITIEPGKSAEQEFVLEEPVVPVERIRAEGGGRVSVQFKGWCSR